MLRKYLEVLGRVNMIILYVLLFTEENFPFDHNLLQHKNDNNNIINYYNDNLNNKYCHYCYLWFIYIYVY